MLLLMVVNDIFSVNANTITTADEQLEEYAELISDCIDAESYTADGKARFNFQRILPSRDRDSGWQGIAVNYLLNYSNN